MKITIKKEVFSKFPELKVAFIKVEKIKNHHDWLESTHLLREMEELVRLSFNKDNYQSHQLIAPWVVARREFGSQAKQYHTSVELLLKKVIHHHRIIAPDTLTNLLHYLSLKYILPLGADDICKLNGNIIFSLASGEEKIKSREKLLSNALYYRDQKQVLGTKLDYWKNEKTALTKESSSVLIHVECLPPCTSLKLKSVLSEAQKLIRTFCGGKVKMVLLSRKKSSASI